jgi:hypothetical protein
LNDGVIRRRMDKSVRDVVARNGLASCMNATKWKELAIALQAIDGCGPRVRLKYVSDEHALPGFTHLEWEWLKSGDTSAIEWMEIDPIHRIHRGRLVPNAEKDNGNEIRSILKSIGVPFSIENTHLRVWGYVKSSAQPEFV